MPLSSLMTGLTTALRSGLNSLFNPTNTYSQKGTGGLVTNPITGNSVLTLTADQSMQQMANVDNYLTQVAMANMQNDWNINMWELNNEYNSPSAQRQRLIDAGYNPLMMNEGSFGASSAPSAADMSASVPSLPTNPDTGLQALGTIMDVVQSFANIRKVRADTKKVEQEVQFAPEQFASEMDCKAQLYKFVGMRMQDFDNAMKYNSKHRDNEIIRDAYQNDLLAQGLKEMQETFDARREALGWATKIKKIQWEQMQYDYENAEKKYRLMDAQTLVAEATRKKIIAETTTIDELRDDQLELIRKQCMRYDMDVFMAGLDIPKSFRGGLYDVLSRYGGSTQGIIAGLAKTTWYKEPNDILRALLVAYGLINGQSLDDAEGATARMLDSGSSSRNDASPIGVDR